jgi:hypothetical protein
MTVNAFIIRDVIFSDLQYPPCKSCDLGGTTVTTAFAALF